jgi:hypothetical protein
VRLGHHWKDGASDQVPVLTQIEGPHGLDVEDVLDVVVGSPAEGHVVLERQADEVGDGVLGSGCQIARFFGRERY